MRNVIRGILGGLLGAFVGGVLFAGAWFAVDWLGAPLPALLPGLYFGLAAGTGCGVLLGMGTRIPMGFALRAASLTLGLAAVGTGVGHLVGRLIYGGLGGGWIQALEMLEPSIRMGVYLATGLGTAAGALSGALLAGSSLVKPASAPALQRGEDSAEAALPPERSPKKTKGSAERPSGKGKGEPAPKKEKSPLDDIPQGEHPADSMSVEELLGDMD